MFAVSLIIGLVGGFIAALMAYIIVYEEYQKHKFRGRRLFKQAFSAAVVAFIFFLLLSIVFTYLLGFIV